MFFFSSIVRKVCRGIWPGLQWLGAGRSDSSWPGRYYFQRGNDSRALQSAREIILWVRERNNVLNSQAWTFFVFYEMPSKCHCYIRWNFQAKYTYIHNYIYYCMCHYIHSIDIMLCVTYISFYISLYICVNVYSFYFKMWAVSLGSVEAEGKTNFLYICIACKNKAFCKQWRGYRVLIGYPCEYVLFFASLDGLNHFLHDTFPLLSLHKHNVKIYGGG